MQEYDQLELRDLESELYSGSEDYSNDREYCDDDDDDDDDGDLSYIETGRSLFNIPEPAERSTLPTDLINFNDGISDDSDEENDYMAIRSLVLYGRKPDCLMLLGVLSILVTDWFFTVFVTLGQLL